MAYPIESALKAEYRASLPKRRALTYDEGLEIADKIGAYLKQRSAELVTGPGELSRQSIQIWNNAGEWVYHLYDTTLFAEIRPFRFPGEPAKMNVSFGTAGKNANIIFKDLQSIVESYFGTTRGHPLCGHL